MSPKLWAYVKSCSKQELRELIEFGVFVSDPLSQELFRKLTEP